jgi:hypothetical protein
LPAFDFIRKSGDSLQGKATEQLPDLICECLVFRDAAVGDRADESMSAFSVGEGVD